MSYEEKFESGKKETVFGYTLNNSIFIKGTKISVREVLRKLSEGNSADDIIKSHSEISVSDIHLCLEFASELVGASDLKESLTVINFEKQKRKDLADKIRSFKGKPPPGWTE